MEVIKQRRHQAFDILKMYIAVEQGDLRPVLKWNKFLNRCIKNLNINDLTTMRKQVQVGMDDLAKAHLNMTAVMVYGLRLQKSLEVTAREILRIKHPNPHDNSLLTSEHSESAYAAKKARDHEFEKFLKSSAY